jgi:acetyl esterase/lipase
VVFIHGGGFSGGSRSQGLATAQFLITRGYAVASIDYRLSGEAKFPAQIHDVKAAIRYLKANASTYALRTDRFATWGESAGAGLAALAGTSGGVLELEDLSMGNSTQDSRVQAVVDLFGPINFLTMNSEWTLLGVTNGQDHDASNSPESQLIGAPIQTRPDLCALYNPEAYLSSDDPAFIVQHGSKDPLIPYLQGKNFAEKLTAMLGPAKVTWMLMDGAGHGGAAFNSAGNLSLLAAFLDRFLK